MSSHDVYFYMMAPKLYTTEQAAKRGGISRQTLQAWIKNKKILPPSPTLDGARSSRLWERSDIERLKRIKKKIYWKGPGRPRKKT
jgi:excisionase family DNA binding protein